MLHTFKSKRAPFSGRGFTLIEILVVISLVAILSLIGLSSFVGARKRGRDAKRISDMKAVQGAFEQYYGANGSYDATCSDMAASMQGGVLPSDPFDTGTSVYSLSCTAGVAGSYCVCALLEDSEGNATNTSCNFATADQTHFCVENLQ